MSQSSVLSPDSFICLFSISQIRDRASLSTSAPEGCHHKPSVYNLSWLPLLLSWDKSCVFPIIDEWLDTIFRKQPLHSRLVMTVFICSLSLFPSCWKAQHHGWSLFLPHHHGWGPLLLLPRWSSSPLLWPQQRGLRSDEEKHPDCIWCSQSKSPRHSPEARWPVESNTQEVITERKNRFAWYLL